MKRKNYDTVTEAMADLKARGYTIDFSILADQNHLVSSQTPIALSPDDFEIDAFYRFEGDSDPGDEMIVYAISSTNNDLKGLIVSAYGIHADRAADAMVKKLSTQPEQETTDTPISEGTDPNDNGGVPAAKDTHPNTWGYQHYDGKIRTRPEDKQIDVNNHKESYMLTEDFVKVNIDGFALKPGVVKKEDPNENDIEKG